jgi:hypothetical protein
MPDINELYDETQKYESFSEKYFGISWAKFLLLSSLVLIIGLYIGVLMFGDNSLDVLLDLETYEEHLKNEVIRLKTENATLQKEFFELKELESN